MIPEPAEAKIRCAWLGRATTWKPWICLGTSILPPAELTARPSIEPLCSCPHHWARQSPSIVRARWSSKPGQGRAGPFHNRNAQTAFPEAVGASSPLLTVRVQELRNLFDE